LMGNGDGTFKEMPLGISGTPIAIGDLSGDGIPDLVMKATPYVVNAYAGNGDGTFQGSPFYTTSLSSSPSPAPVQAASIGDVNADGHPDLVVEYSVQANATVVVSSGDGNGNFTTDGTQYYAGNITPNQETNPGNFGILTRLNSLAGTPSTDNAFDYLTLTDNGATALLNTNYETPFNVNRLVSKTALTVSSNTAAPNQPLTFTATITGVDNPNGLISFVSGGTTLGNVITNKGVASLTTSFTADGTYPVVANFLGDLNNLPSVSGSVTVSVAPVTSQTTLAVSTNDANEKQQLNFTATVAGFNPTGSVTFVAGGTTLGTATVTNGVATLPFQFTSAGSFSVTANYGGDNANLASVSNTLVIVVAAPDFSVAASPTTATVAPGQSATTTLTLTPVAGYGGTVKLSCGTLPAGATCSFAPSSVTPANGAAATTTLTIATTAPSTTMASRIAGAVGGIAWASVFFFALSPRRNGKANRKLAGWAMLALLMVCGSVLLSGCGGGGGSSKGSGTTNPGTPAGVQSITVSAADSGGGPAHSLTFQLTVQ
jgi:hypothetical protein